LSSERKPFGALSVPKALPSELIELRLSAKPELFQFLLPSGRRNLIRSFFQASLEEGTDSALPGKPGRRN
jgi:hypothetical protein